jgi:hypothetical protein
MRHTLATVPYEDLKFLEDAENRVVCARQAIRLDALPAGVSAERAEYFFREAIFAYADAQWLRNVIAHEIGRQYKIEKQVTDAWYIDFNSGDLYIEENG